MLGSPCGTNARLSVSSHPFRTYALVMAGLVPAIYALVREVKSWITGSSPVMTTESVALCAYAPSQNSFGRPPAAFSVAVISIATAIMAATPSALIASCIATPPDHAFSISPATKASGTPRQ